jgi:site-specific recombinase XerD
MTSRGLSDNTVRRRRWIVTKFAAELGSEQALLKVKAPVIERWLISLGVSPQSKAYYARDLTAFYRWAVHQGLRKRNPMDGREPEKMPQHLPRPIATGDLRAALDAAHPRTRQMLVLAAFAGLRAHEIAGLDVSDIDRERGVMTIRGKGGRDRVIPLHEMVAEVLPNIRRGPVIPRLKGKGDGVTPGTVSRVVARHLKAVTGSGADTCHPLRHWFATEALEEIGDVRVVQELLGHANLNTTAVYTKVSDARKRAAVAALSLSA